MKMSRESTNNLWPMDIGAVTFLYVEKQSCWDTKPVFRFK